MDKHEMTSEQQLAFDGFIDVMVQIYKMTSDKIDYSKVEKAKDKRAATAKRLEKKHDLEHEHQLSGIVKRDPDSAPLI